ncbi:hypothetical protein EV361DRAFT_346748 [Lentinula raphanica]|uniref:Uncharacterized protein n=1 Tax=Lentinula raphanica TaxID=153919 RepID=A0AA38P5Q4_9AGAR|nr:hypothetical protein F5880DRAFT_1507693 [Lentinula raphanica]KAJ3836828.1 hypothetical protein F5878DRAFT_243701 [Lentinula raphanica]KAJ3969502.1 hypothetical protein EV361DRAFT_346748 [Lentinula raphanica]
MRVKIITLVLLLASAVHAAPMMNPDNAGTLHRSSDSVAESFYKPPSRALEKRMFSLQKLRKPSSSKNKQPPVYYAYFYMFSTYYHESSEPTMSPVPEPTVPEDVREHTQFLVDRFNKAYGDDSTPVSLVYQNSWFTNARVTIIVSSPEQETQSELFVTLGQESGSGYVSNGDKELYVSVVRFLDKYKNPLPSLTERSEKPEVPRKLKKRMQELVDMYFQRDISPTVKVYLNLQTGYVAPKSRESSVWFSFTTSTQPLQAELNLRKDIIHKPAFPVSGGPS